MSSLRDENKRLSQSVAELRADRRAQDRKIRDLEHEMALQKINGPQRLEPVPQLPVEVMAPPPAADAPRVVGIADDGSEIVYEGDAALGKAAVIDLGAAEPARNETRVARADPDSRRAAATMPVAARASRSAVRSDVNDEAANTDYRAAVGLVKTASVDEATTAPRAFLAKYRPQEYAAHPPYRLGGAFHPRLVFPRPAIPPWGPRSLMVPPRLSSATTQAVISASTSSLTA